MDSNVKYLACEKNKPLVRTVATKPTDLEPNEVLIRLKAIAINPADCKTIDEGHRADSWPLVPGLDGSGIVEAIGKSVENFLPGDDVLAMFSCTDRGGSYQNFAVVPEGMVAKKPAAWSFEDASTVAYVSTFLFPLFTCRMLRN